MEAKGALIRGLFDQLQQIAIELVKRAGQLGARILHFLRDFLLARGHITLYIPGDIMAQYNKVLLMYKGKLDPFFDMSKRTMNLVHEFLKNRKIGRSAYNKMKESVEGNVFDGKTLDDETVTLVKMIQGGRNSGAKRIPVKLLSLNNTRYTLQSLADNADLVKAQVELDMKSHRTEDLNDKENHMYDTLMTYYKGMSRTIGIAARAGATIIKMTTALIKMGGNPNAKSK